MTGCIKGEGIHLYRVEGEEQMQDNACFSGLLCAGLGHMGRADLAGGMRRPALDMLSLRGSRTSKLR